MYSRHSKCQKATYFQYSEHIKHVCSIGYFIAMETLITWKESQAGRKHFTYFILAFAPVILSTFSQQCSGTSQLEMVLIHRIKTGQEVVLNPRRLENKVA